MPSAFDNENEMVMGAIMSEIADQLLDDWIQSNLDEGQLYADWQIADRCDSNYLKDRFNQFYDLTPDSQYYVEVE